MLLYNVTTIIDEDTEADWLNWIKEEHIPAVMATNLFTSNRLLKVLDSPNEGVTYCIQYIADSAEQYRSYIENFDQAIQFKHHNRFANKYVSFSTLMEFADYQ